MEDFKNLKVWGKAHLLTLAIYEITRKFPREEVFGLTSQIRRASASIGANIAVRMRPAIGSRDETICSDRTRLRK